MDSLFGSMLARPLLTAEDRSALESLRAALEETDYSEEAVRPLLGSTDIALRRHEEVPGYLARCEEAGTLGVWTALWLLWEPVPRARLEGLLGAQAVERLIALRLLRADGGHLRAEADLYPCQGSYLLTDHKFTHQRFPNHVYELGKDSYVLARVTPRQRVGRALDLCTGSGVHAILACGHARESWGVDLNPRALDFCRLNSALNGLEERCSFERGDLYQPAGSRTFELITANPPFLPTPEQDMELYRPGGETGEEITERIVRGLTDHLSVGGVLSLFTNYPVVRSSHVLDRMQAWLGGGKGWGLAVLDFGWIRPETFVTLHLSPTASEYSKRFRAWLDSYRRLGIDGVMAGNLFVRRLPPDRPGWRIQKLVPFPERSIHPRVERWLDAAETYLDPAWEPDWEEWIPRLHEEVGLWVEPRQGDARTTFPDPWPEETLNPEETELALQLSSGLTAQRLACAWAEEKGLPRDAARPRLAKLFRQLGRKMVLS
ncbi:MAG: methyltransferase [Armatimonadetes bacterium]|nr:methyltransferase [Armatimonadota bacterium]